jgi:itaconate CoA-transferase
MYQTEYREKLLTPEQAAARVADGSTFFHGMASAEPPALLGAVADRLRRGDLHQIKVYSMLPLATAARTILAPDLTDEVYAHSFFLSPVDRGLVRGGLAYFVPCNFHEIPRLCRDFLDIDVMFTTVSPMDRAGYFTFGTVNDYTSTAARQARCLIVEVNRHMPRVFGDSLLHVSEVDGIVEHDAALVELTPAESGPEDDVIGRTIAQMVPDGATIQLGIGGIPATVARYLEHHTDLGIHTELFSPAMMDLIKKGVVTGRRKTLHPRKHVFTNALGTRELYEFIHDNPSMESYPVSYTNAPEIIARNDDLVSINATIQVDLAGQCNSEVMTGSEFSGTGGQVDFARGAFMSRGGKSIIAFHSTAKGGEVSRVVPRLDSDAAVTLPRTETHYLVTEHGVANLKGKSTSERALAIVELAHPRFRDDLLRAAERAHLL